MDDCDCSCCLNDQCNDDCECDCKECRDSREAAKDREHDEKCALGYK